MSLIHKLFCHHPTVDDKDKGSAWAVLFWSTIAHLLHLGFLGGSYGSLTIQHQHTFNITLLESGLIGSVNNFVLLCFAPVASVMVVKLSARLVQIFGGLCILVGIGGSAFATEAWHAYLLVGVVAGIGFSSTYMASSSVLLHHFDRHKYLAFSTVTMGTFVGVIVWPMISQTLFDTLGYSTSMGIMGLILCLHIVCGAFFTEEQNHGSSCVRDVKCCQKLDEGKENQCDSLQKIGCDNVGLESDSSCDKSEKNDSNRGIDESISGVDEPANESGVIKRNQKPRQILKDLKQLLTNWMVWCLLLNYGLWNFNVVAFLVFVNDYMVVHVGLTETQAALGITILGVANVIGNIAAILASKIDFNRLAMYMALSIIFGICTIIIPFTTSMAMFYALTAVWGLAQGAHLATILSVCYDFCGEELLAILFGLTLCAAGITGVTTSPLCGYLQTTVHPVAGLCLAGASGIAASIVLVPVLVRNIANKRKAEKDTLKALVIGDTKGLQAEVIEDVTKAADANYPQLQFPLHNTVK